MHGTTFISYDLIYKKTFGYFCEYFKPKEKKKLSLNWDKFHFVHSSVAKMFIKSVLILFKIEPKDF